MKKTKMRLTANKIEDVIKYVVGDEALPIIKKLKKDNISEYELAKAIKNDIKKTRNILYKLYENDLVSFDRKKDKIKGWYIYFWTFKPERIKWLHKKIKQEQLDKLKEALQTEQTGQFYSCPTKCTRLDFDQAVNFEFVCPECGKLVQQEDKEKNLENIKKQIHLLEKEIKIIK